MRMAALTLATALAIGGSASAQHLRIGLAEDPDILDPTTARTFVGRIVFASICDKLVDIDKDLKLVPQLATEWSWSQDQLSLTMKLRPGVTFHDGEKFDAAAAKDSLERHLNFPESRRRTEISQIKSIDVVDPLTIRMNLSTPFSPLLAQLADRAGMMMSPKATKAAGAAFGNKPVCAGPYKFVERVQQDRIVVERVADHWDKASVHFDKITYLPIVDATVRLANLQSGQIDFAERVAATDVGKVKADNRLKLYQVVSLGYTGITVNVGNSDKAKNPLGQDKRIRQALELAMDRDAISQVVFDGNVHPGNQWVPTSNSWYAKGVPIPKRDVAKAKELLKQAGVPNLSFTMMVPNGNEILQVAQVIQAMAKEAGIDIKIQATEFATSLQLAAKGDFEAHLIGWSGRPDPDGNIYVFNACDGAQNDGKYCRKDMDEQLTLARSTNDIEKRASHYLKVAKLHAEDLPRIYLYHPVNFYASGNKLSGFQEVPDALVRVRGIKMN